MSAVLITELLISLESAAVNAGPAVYDSPSSE
jgi:hypothetical protein